MNDKDLCAAFGTTLEEVEVDVEAFENGTWEDFRFGEPVDGDNADLCLARGAEKTAPCDPF